MLCSVSHALKDTICITPSAGTYNFLFDAELLRSDNGTLGSHALPVINAPLALLEEVNTVASGFHGGLSVALAHASRTIHGKHSQTNTATIVSV